jgi:hypothetical protein
MPPSPPLWKPVTASMASAVGVVDVIVIPAGRRPTLALDAPSAIKDSSKIMAATVAFAPLAAQTAPTAKEHALHVSLVSVLTPAGELALQQAFSVLTDSSAMGTNASPVRPVARLVPVLLTHVSSALVAHLC